MKKLKPCSPSVINNNISWQTACKIYNHQVRATPCSILLRLFCIFTAFPSSLQYETCWCCVGHPPHNPKTDSVLCLRLTGLLTAAALLSECQLTNNHAIVSPHVALFTSSPPTTLWAVLFLLTSPIASTPSTYPPPSTPLHPRKGQLPPLTPLSLPRSHHSLLPALTGKRLSLPPLPSLQAPLSAFSSAASASRLQ